MNTYLRKIKKNTKALSPVVASIILIAVTVAVSVVVAAWMGGMSIGLMGNAEQGTITNIGFSTFSGNTTKCLVVTVTNSGSAPMTITNAYVNTVAILNTDPVLSLEIPKQSSQNIVLNVDYNAGTEYAVKLTTAKGNNLVLSAFAP